MQRKDVVPAGGQEGQPCWMWLSKVFANRSSALLLPAKVTIASCLWQISEEEIERIMSGQEFEGEANMSWSNNGDSDHSSPGNGVSESNQPSPVSTPSSRWEWLWCYRNLGFLSLSDTWGQCRENVWVHLCVNWSCSRLLPLWLCSKTNRPWIEKNWTGKWDVHEQRKTSLSWNYI